MEKRSEDSLYQAVRSVLLIFTALVTFKSDLYRVYTWYLRYRDADDHVIELQALLLQLVLNVDITASAAL